MKNKFFDQLKDYLIKNEDKYLRKLIRYYETLKQNSNTLQPLIDDMRAWKLDFQYHKGSAGGYMSGKILIYLYAKVDDNEDEWSYYNNVSPDYHYEIELNRDERYWGYCVCTPDMEGYNEKYKCCGDGCDWVAPSFSLSKIIHLGSGNFNGAEKNMWKLEGEWENELDSFKEKEKQKRIKHLKDRIKEIKADIKRIENE